MKLWHLCHQHFPFLLDVWKDSFHSKLVKKVPLKPVVVVSRGVVQPSECEVLSGHPLELHSDTLTGSDQQEAGGWDSFLDLSSLQTLSHQWWLWSDEFLPSGRKVVYAGTLISFQFALAEIYNYYKERFYNVIQCCQSRLALWPALKNKCGFN